MRGGRGTRASGNSIVVLAFGLGAAYSCLPLGYGEVGLRRIVAGLRFEQVQVVDRLTFITHGYNVFAHLFRRSLQHKRPQVTDLLCCLERVLEALDWYKARAGAGPVEVSRDRTGE